MNRVEFRITYTNNRDYMPIEDDSDVMVDYDLQVRTIVDGKDLLLQKELYGLDADKFLEESDSIKEGEKLLGICCCGCEGCCDYIVDISLNDNIVIWYDYQKKEKYQFTLEQYTNAIDAARQSYIKIMQKRQMEDRY